MAKKEETKLAEKWDAILKKEFGSDIEVENIQQVAKVGTPDRLICLCGLHVSLEYKTSRGILSKIQQYKLKKYQKAGGFTAVVTPETFYFVLDELKNLHRKAKLILSR